MGEHMVLVLVWLCVGMVIGYAFGVAQTSLRLSRRVQEELHECHQCHAESKEARNGEIPDQQSDEG